ncbi:MAG: hypothetical protein FIA91_02645 [Geobacter sp.]|nr:hypothetical protein [Geobacter sp.]
MRKVIEALSWLTLFLLLIFISGCSVYYAVRDTHSDKTYYTTEIVETTAGAVSFIDEKSKMTVTVSSPEVSKLDSAEYKAALSAAPASKVKPVGIRNRDEAN